MVNMTQDECFGTEEACLFFDAIPARSKRIMFWNSDHHTWAAEAIRHSVEFVNEHTR